MRARAHQHWGLLARSQGDAALAARLADARFFFGEDRKRTLAERRGDLERVTFHEKLGSYAAKSDRIVELALALCDQLGDVGLRTPTRQAAELLKIDRSATYGSFYVFTRADAPEPALA